MRSLIGASLVFGLVHVSQGGGTVSLPPPTPQVFGIVVGVTNYPHLPLAGCDRNAYEFYEAVTNTFPGGDIRLLTNEAAIPGVIESLLEYKVPDLPAYSVFIFYFCGHGVRRQYAGGGGWSECYLLLSNGEHKLKSESPTNSLAVSKVVNAVYRLDRGTAMIFLDCCHSGPEDTPFEKPEAVLARIKVKAFMLGASPSSTEALSGVLTKALIQSWKQPVTNGCMTPRLLEELVQQNIPARFREVMWPRLSFGGELDRCISGLNRPSSLIILDFEKGISEAVQIKLRGGVINRLFDPKKDDECFYPILVERQPLTIAVHRVGSPKPIWETNILAYQLNEDVLRIGVVVPKGLQNMKCERWVTLQAMGDTVKGYGADPGKFYAEAAHNLTPGRVQERLAILAAGAEKGDYADFFKSALEAVRQPENNLVFAQVAMDADKALDWIGKFESIGAKREAAKLSDALMAAVDRPDIRTFLAFRNAINARLENRVEPPELFPPDSLSKLAPGQVYCVAAVSKATLPKLRELKAALPNSLNDWRQLATAEGFARMNVRREIENLAPAKKVNQALDTQIKLYMNELESYQAVLKSADPMDAQIQYLSRIASLTRSNLALLSNTQMQVERIKSDPLFARLIDDLDDDTSQEKGASQLLRLLEKQKTEKRVACEDIYWN